MNPSESIRLLELCIKNLGDQPFDEIAWRSVTHTYLQRIFPQSFQRKQEDIAAYFALNNESDQEIKLEDRLRILLTGWISEVKNLGEEKEHSASEILHTNPEDKTGRTVWDFLTSLTWQKIITLSPILLTLFTGFLTGVWHPSKPLTLNLERSDSSLNKLDSGTTSGIPIRPEKIDTTIPSSAIDSSHLKTTISLSDSAEEIRKTKAAERKREENRRAKRIKDSTDRENQRFNLSRLELTNVTHGVHRSFGGASQSGTHYSVSMIDGGRPNRRFEMAFNLTQIDENTYSLQRTDCGDAPTTLTVQSPEALSGGPISLNFKRR